MKWQTLLQKAAAAETWINKEKKKQTKTQNIGLSFALESNTFMHLSKFSYVDRNSNSYVSTLS